jgi:hypothetical protein
VTGVGSGAVTSTKTTGDWDIKEFPTNYLEAVSGHHYDGVDLESSGVRITGTIKNLTSATSVVIDSIEVDNDTAYATDGDDISIETTGDDIVFASGDLYEINFAGTCAPGILAYSNLVEGTHIHLGGGDGAIFGKTTINVVPEPATMSLLAIGGLALIRRKRRRA